MNRLMVNICSENLEQSKLFYLQLFDFELMYDSDWFIQLRSKNQQLEIGLIAPGSEVVPSGINAQPQGIYLTIVVDEVESVLLKAKEKDLSVIQAPEDTFYGQRRLLLKDPNGVVVDVSAPIKDFKGMPND